MLGTKLVSIPIIKGEVPEIGKPSTVVDLGVSGGLSRSYDVSLDSTWFVGVERDPTAPPDEIEVVLNWFEELKERAPMK